jgi:hypothetical protein
LCCINRACMFVLLASSTSSATVSIEEPRPFLYAAFPQLITFLPQSHPPTPHPLVRFPDCCCH